VRLHDSWEKRGRPQTKVLRGGARVKGEGEALKHLIRVEKEVHFKDEAELKNLD